MKRKCNPRIIGFRRSNKGRAGNIYMIRECDYCHAILEFPSDEVSSEQDKYTIHREYVICPNCENKVTVIESRKENEKWEK